MFSGTLKGLKEFHVKKNNFFSHSFFGVGKGGSDQTNTAYRGVR